MILRNIGIVAIVSLLVFLNSPSLVFAQHEDMSGTWIVQEVNDGGCLSLFVLDDSGPVRLTKETKDWKKDNGNFEGQTEYYLGEGAYKCAFSSGSTRQYLEFALEQFNQAINLQIGPVDSRPLNEEQVLKLHFRRAWCYFRLSELSNTSEMRIKSQLNNCLVALSHGSLMTNGGSLGLGAGYLTATVNLQLLKMAYWDAARVGSFNLQSSLGNLINSADSVFAEFSQLDGGSTFSDELLDIDQIKISEAIRLNQISCGLILARLKIMRGDDVDGIFSDIYTLLANSDLDLFFSFEYERLKWIKKERFGGGGLVGLADGLSNIGIQQKTLLLELLNIEQFKSSLLFGQSSLWNGGPPVGKYWLAKAQLSETPKLVTDSGGIYEPERLLSDYLASPPVFGDQFFRMDAKLLLQEIAYEEAKILPTKNARKAEYRKIAAALEGLNFENSELVKRKKSLLIKLSIRGIGSSGIALDDETALLILIEEASAATEKKRALESLGLAEGRLNNLEDDSSFKNEWCFYWAIVCQIRAVVEQETPRAPKKYLERSINYIDTMPDKSSPYYIEGSYVAAISAKKLDFYIRTNATRAEAIRRLQDIVTTQYNVRALYHLAALYDATENISAKKYISLVKWVIMGKPGYNWANDPFYEWAKALYPVAGSSNNVEIGPNSGTMFDASLFDYPHSVLKDGLYLEGFADKDVLRKQKKQDLLRTLSEFYPIPLTVYASETQIDGWCFDSSFPALTSGISEGPKAVMSGLDMIVYPESSSSVVFDGKKIKIDPNTNSYLVRDIAGGSEHSLEVHCPGYFGFSENHTFFGTPSDPKLRFMHLAQRTEYGNSNEEIVALSPASFGAGNFVQSPISVEEIAFLKHELGDEIRDFAKVGEFFYCVSAVKNNILKVAANGIGNPKPFLKGHILISPEGIAVDRAGNFYITDFAAHQVVVFDSTGQYTYHFGLEIGKQKLQFPTRVALEEDFEGFLHDKKPYYRPTFLYVSDWNGVHRMDLSGHPIDTVVTSENSNMKPGDFYSIEIEGYGPGAKLSVLKRDGKKALEYKASAE